MVFSQSGTEVQEAQEAQKAQVKCWESDCLSHGILGGTLLWINGAGLLGAG